MYELCVLPLTFGMPSCMKGYFQLLFQSNMMIKKKAKVEASSKTEEGEQSWKSLFSTIPILNVRLLLCLVSSSSLATFLSLCIKYMEHTSCTDIQYFTVV